MMNTTADRSALTTALDDGKAEYMGDVFVILQRDRAGRQASAQSVVLSLRDLEALRANRTDLAPIRLEDGEAHRMGDGLFVILQADKTRRGHPVQNVVVSANDAKTMLTLAA